MSRKRGSTGAGISDIQGNSRLLQGAEMKPMTSKEGRSAYYERPAKEGKRDKEAERKAKICLSCTKAKCKGTCELMRSRNG